MFWKVLSRTLYSIFAIWGIVMQVLGAYFDIIQAATTPTGPFGLSVFIWGVILFDIASISIIVQLWWHIHTIENQYSYALSSDSLKFYASTKDIQVTLLLRNTIDKPIEYKFNVENIYLEIGGEHPIDNSYFIVGSIISGREQQEFKLPVLKIPAKIPCVGTIHYELMYGRPGRMMFYQKKEIEIYVQTMDENLYFSYNFTLEEEGSTKKQDFNK